MALGAEEEGVLLSDVSGFGAIGGRGVTRAVDGIEVVVGTPKLLADRGFVVPMSSPTAWRKSRAKGNGFPRWLGRRGEGDDRCCRHAP